MTGERYRAEFEGTHARIIQTREVPIRKGQKSPPRLEICILESGKWVRLAPFERRIFERLMLKMGEVVSHEELKKVSGVKDNAGLSVNINRLNGSLVHAQKHIGSLGVYVLSVRERGYVLYSTDQPDAFSLEQERSFAAREKKVFPNK